MLIQPLSRHPDLTDLTGLSALQKAETFHNLHENTQLGREEGAI